MNTLLLATDGSDSSERALTFAIELAVAIGACLHVVSVRPPRMPRRAGAPALELDELEGAEQIAEAGAARARAAGLEATARVAHGDIVSCIAEAARALAADMLIVGSRGLGSVSGATLGSVSQALVRRSPVPVTVVRHATRVVAALRT
jgi:nucleotide-binding universal stress UspA family protein